MNNLYAYANILNNTIKPNPATYKKDYTHEQVECIPEMQGWVQCMKQPCYQPAKEKKKNHMIISTDTEKYILQYLTSIHIKTLSKQEIEIKT